jgi:hypothetical protein
LNGARGVVKGEFRVSRGPGNAELPEPCDGSGHDFWAGALVAGRTVVRDRDAEFTASGPVAGLVERVIAAKEQLRADPAAAAPAEPLRAPAPAKYRETPAGRSQGGALQHVYEEPAQHHGQLELTRDVLLHH